MSGLTKMLIVLQLVFALVCSVLLVLMVSKQENYKTAVDASNARVTGLAASLVNEQGKVAAANTEKAAAQKTASEQSSRANELQAQLTAAQSAAGATALELKAAAAALEMKNSELSAALAAATESIKAKDGELDKLRPQIADLNGKYSEINRAKSEADNLLRAAEQTIRKLQEQLAQGGGAGSGSVAPLGSEGQITTLSANTNAAQVNGKITSVQTGAGRVLIELPLGTRDGLQKSSRIYVYRATGYVGDAVIETVTPDQSIAVMEKMKPGETVREGDLVATVGK